MTNPLSQTDLRKLAEQWRPVVGYEALYEISSMGRIRRIAGTKFCPSGRILKPMRHLNDYLYVTLSDDGDARNFLMHTLVLESFVCPRPEGMECAHGNGKRDDNRAENLRWATRSENHADKKAHGTNTAGEKHWKAKLTDGDIRSIRRLYGGMNQNELAKMFGVNQKTVSRVVRRQAWAHI